MIRQSSPKLLELLPFGTAHGPQKAPDTQDPGAIASGDPVPTGDGVDGDRAEDTETTIYATCGAAGGLLMIGDPHNRPQHFRQPEFMPA